MGPELPMNGEGKCGRDKALFNIRKYKIMNAGSKYSLPHSFM